MKKIINYLFFFLGIGVVLSCTSKAQVIEEITLKEALKDKFYIGVALNREQYMGEDKKAHEIVIRHFNSIVAENCMKSEKVQPREGEFFFDDADKFIEYGLKNNMQIIGHTLIWHSQAPDWFFTDENGNDVSPEVLTERMRNHIYTVMNRYKGKVDGWDVVNEAIEDNGSFRNSKFYQILGEDFIKLAFQFAHEADPDAKLHYNDFSMSIPRKCAGVVRMVKSLQEQGIKIDAIGMQGHLHMDGPTTEEFEKSLLAFSELGVKVMITELELSALPSPWKNIGANISDAVEYQDTKNPYPDGLPAEVEKQWEDHYLNLFKLFLKHQDKISRVTLWGVEDGSSWKNDFPIRGRTDYPLLFDRNYQEKPIVRKIIQEALK